MCVIGTIRARVDVRIATAQCVDQKQTIGRRSRSAAEAFLDKYGLIRAYSQRARCRTVPLTMTKWMIYGLRLPGPQQARK